MATRLNPYLRFDGNARQAMEFYRDVLGGELSTNLFSDFSDDPSVADKVMHAQLETEGDLTLMASDTPPGSEHRPGNNIAISLSGDDADKLRNYWQRLSEGGQVTVPLEKQMWGDEYGSCIDRFGVEWMINISQAG
ncbi:MAG TPA: VOC family protein [Micromonosporaceae bacterium]|nr:VOC family protein [Micromonosporaceae bacterium]